jgi:hypothetical protein
MSITLATGTTVSIASTYGASKAMSAISNAAEAVATLEAAHGVIVGDILEVTSGWDLLNGRLVRVSAVTVNDVTFDDIDTSNTTNYPAGTGTGSIREITAWTQITQIQSVESSGGDLSFADITTIVDRTQKQVPTTRSPIQLTFTVFDDPTLTWYAIVLAAAEASIAYGLRVVFPNASRLLANGFYSLQTTPNINVNAPLTAPIGFSASATPTRYST